MFENTVRLVEECGLTYLHVFPFSPRRGTPAARMPQVPLREVKARARRLREKGDEALARFLARQHGTETEILLEKDGVGRTPHYAELRLARPGAVGSLARARVTGHEGRHLVGEVIA
jgi:threonylcarbamoyladenosine tRNA methylthiotransferase MtaB